MTLKRWASENLLLVIATLMMLGIGGAAILTMRANAAQVSMRMPPPPLPFGTAARDVLPPDAPQNGGYVLVEFGDYQCPPCKKLHGDLAPFLVSHPEITFYFRHFPLSFHPRAVPAALVAEQARSQGKFQAMHDALFARDARLEDADLMRFATQVGVRLDDAGRAAAKVRVTRDQKAGEKLRVDATPTLILCYPNGTAERTDFHRLKERFGEKGN